MTILEVKKGLLDLMQSLYPKDKYKYYSKSVVENYSRPSFFTQLMPVSMDIVNYNTRENQVAFYITYMQEKADEADALNMIQSIRDLFNINVLIGNRSVRVIDFTYDFIGSERNIPQITIDLEWMDKIEHKNDAPIIESVEIKKNINGGRK